jgi:hypothetical protein
MHTLAKINYTKYFLTIQVPIQMFGGVIATQLKVKLTWNCSPISCIKKVTTVMTIKFLERSDHRHLQSEQAFNPPFWVNIIRFVIHLYLWMVPHLCPYGIFHMFWQQRKYLSNQQLDPRIKWMKSKCISNPWSVISITLPSFWHDRPRKNTWHHGHCRLEKIPKKIFVLLYNLKVIMDLDEICTPEIIWQVFLV